MKTPSLLRVIALITLATSLVAGPRDAQWKKVYEAQQKGLPKTAIEKLEPIITGAIADRTYGEAIKAIGEKIMFESDIQGSKAEDNLVRLQAMLPTAPSEIKPVLEAILAQGYWRYFQQNRARFMQRSQSAEAPGIAIEAWDVARILTEIDRHFTAALADDKFLRTIPVAALGDLIESSTVPGTHRPSMFDFLAYNALQFYQTGEHAALHAEDEFALDADSPIFADATEFMAWQPLENTHDRPEATDETSPALKAILLYQRLLRFHQADPDRADYYDADLARLTYGHNTAVGENKDERYKTALRRFIDATAKHEISARALAALATQCKEEHELAQAHDLAQRGLTVFPQSSGALMCFDLKQQIEEKSTQLGSDQVWNAKWTTLDLTYRNVTKVYFRAVPATFEDPEKIPLSDSSKYSDERELYQREKYKQLLAATPVLRWEADLPPTTDFKEHTARLPTPSSLKPGFYDILVSHDASFGITDNRMNTARVCVTDLVLIRQAHADAPYLRGFLLKAGSDEPVAGATIHIWQYGGMYDQKYKPIAPIKTDENGRFSLSSSGAVILFAESDGQVISSSAFGVGPEHHNGNSDSQTVLFTDRALYRPGQTISYKGICLRATQANANYQTLNQAYVTVIFRDANGKEISRADHHANDYGSFSGTFTAPRDRLTGRMSLQVEYGSLTGATVINVEEYKRPKFQVELAAPTEAVKLSCPVLLTGKATAYTGAAIGGAQVKWRVERAARLPAWCWWRQPPATGKAIAHGTATSESDGTFKIKFTATPDRSLPGKLEPTFTYSIHADVTDTTGETHSDDRTLPAGYTALTASLTISEWQTVDHPVEITIGTHSLEGTPQPAHGTLLVRTLKQPEKVERTPLPRVNGWQALNPEEPFADSSNPDSWDLNQAVAEQTFQTDNTGKTQIAMPLKAGIYRVSLETMDRFGKKVTARKTVQVVDPAKRHHEIKLPNFFAAPAWLIEPGETFSALWGTGYDIGRAFVELECDGKPLKSYWTAADRTQELIELPITEEMRGGVSLRVTSVRENRAYFNQRIIDVPWSNKQLSLKWESFRTKLLPGQNETWTVIVSGPDAKCTAAEMVATLYDASLDQFALLRWPSSFDVFRHEYDTVHSVLENPAISIGVSFPRYTSRSIDWSDGDFTRDFIHKLWGWGDNDLVLSPFTVSADRNEGHRVTHTMAGTRMRSEPKNVRSPIPVPTQQFLKETGSVGPTPDLSKVNARTNLNETPFFFPHLLTDDNGVVKIQFTLPEALTEWKFLAFAHDQKLRAGFLASKIITAKDIMVEPNPPRFVREGDVIEFTVKVSNQSDKPQTGQVRLTFANAATLQSVDDALDNHATEQAFDVPAKQSRSYSWRIAVPDGMGFLLYKAVGATAQASDGEEGYLPVLSRRILVTESLPLPIRGKTTKQFDFSKLLESGQSNTLHSQSLTVQMMSRPVWYAVMSLPYLMEYPHECSEQLFSRLYANTLARHIANSDPKIRRIFDLWKDTDQFASPLEKNQDLKSLMLEETPWLRQAITESQSRRNTGILFENNRLDEESARALRTLSERQLSDGLWSWFPDGQPDVYISLYITTGFGRLRHLGADIGVAPALESLNALDAWMEHEYRKIISSPHPEKYIPNPTDAFYLYGRSFFLKDRPLPPEHQEAIDFFLRQARRFWLDLGYRRGQAHLAVALQRFGDNKTPQAIMRAIRERSVSSEEMGMFWPESEPSWSWHRAPIETQTMMIEAFDEVAHDPQAVEDCKAWLLSQKQTQGWKSTMATADAIYGLLLRGDNPLASDALVEVSLGGETIKPEKTEAGTGFYEQKFVHNEIKPAMGAISVKKVDEGVSWGSVHWQYLEDMTKVTPHEGTPLKLKKTLFIKETTAKGQVLKAVSGPISVGDELVVRIELRTDRDMEYVHLKDQRGSGTEPVNVLSQYKFQDGLAYYESTRDTASHFFIDYLPKGVYVFEYSTRIQLKGNYQTGIAEIQCMYAPEFNSHSESFTLDVK